MGGQRPKSALIPGLLGSKAANCREFKGFGVGMTCFGSNRRFSRVVLAAAIGMAMVIGFAGSFAQAADEDDDELLDVKIFRGIMKGLGLRRDEGPGIEYRERSPLVLPTAKELPPPESDAAAKKAAGWPDDPDLKRVKQRKETERKRKGFEEGVDDRPLLPSQYGVNAPAKGSKAGEAPGVSAEKSEAPSTNAELGSKGITAMFKGLWAPKEEYTPFTGEPARTTLTEPPPGYRTPSPAQPYGVGKEIRAPSAVDKHEIVR